MNDSLSIRYQSLQLLHAFMSLLAKQEEGIRASRHTRQFRQAKDVDDMQQNQLRPEWTSETPCPFQSTTGLRRKIGCDKDSRDLRVFVPREMILRVHVCPSLAVRGGRFPSYRAVQVSASPFKSAPNLALRVNLYRLRTRYIAGGRAPAHFGAIGRCRRSQTWRG